MKLTDKELLCVAQGMAKALFSRDAYFTKGSAQVFNNTLKKIRINADTRKNKREIIKALGDTVECEDCGADCINGKTCECYNNGES
jgi:hypothetical protein